ncbi:unnamed protein product, partial [Rodentolepis nana]|uniref:Tudor domain-containing protein n=1 Tax=Rodentolepis nana TaxID=102285 RepID=A0A0R3TSI8_RODNA
TIVEKSEFVVEKGANPSVAESNHSEIIASAPVSVSVEGGNLKRSVTPGETERAIVDETKGSLLEEEEVLVASTQNPANSSFASDRDGDVDPTPSPDDGANEETIPITTEVSSEDYEGVESGGGLQAYIGQGLLGVPEHGIVETEPVLLDGIWIGQVIIEDDLFCLDANPNLWRLRMTIPSNMIGRFCGTNGIHVKNLKARYQAKVLVHSTDPNDTTALLEVSCPPEFKVEVLRWISFRTRSPHSITKIDDATKLLRKLPFGELTLVYVRSWYSQKHLFVTIVDSVYEEFLRMEAEMNADYANIGTRVLLSDPIFVNKIAVLRTATTWSRVCILDVVDGSTRCAICFLLDHGVFVVVRMGELVKIKEPYMQIPFQAVSVVWAHAQPNIVAKPDDLLLQRYFSNDSLYVFPVRNETCCRSDVIFFNRIKDTKHDSQYLYQDILVQAVNEGYYRFAGKLIYLDEQFELNGSESAYYFCPYSDVYEALVFYRMSNGEIVRALDAPMPRPVPKPMPQTENQQQHQQGQPEDMQEQQRQSPIQHQSNNRTPNGDAVSTANGDGNNSHNAQNSGNRGRGRGKYVPNGAYRPNRQSNTRTPNGDAVSTANGDGNNSHNAQNSGNRGRGRGKYVPNGAYRPNRGRR